MKKQLTFLLVSLALLVLPGKVNAQLQCDGTESCSITIEGFDSYGDGWEGAAVHIYQDTNLRGTFTVTQSTNSASFSVCPDSVQFYFVLGNSMHYSSEASFTIFSADGSEIITFTGTGNLQGNTPFFSTLVTCPSCIAPALLALDTVTSSSATFSWHSSVNAVNTYYQISASGVNESNWISVNNDYVTISGLSANTEYTFFLYSLCGVGDTSVVVSLPFRTLCGMTDLPYSEGFESTGNGDIPSCWTIYEYYQGYGISYPRVSSSEYYTHNGDRSLLLYNDEDCSIISPVIPIPANEVEVCFWGMCESDDPSDLQIGYVTEPSSDATFHLVKTVSLTDNYQYFNVLFDTVSTTDTVYVVFRTPQTVIFYGESIHAIDDVVIRQVRSCYAPQNLRIAAVGNDAVSLVWNDTVSANTEYQVAYGAYGFSIDSVDESSLMSVYDTNITITGLSNTLYDFYVRTNCSSEQSYWVGPVSAQPGVYCMPLNGSDTVYTCNNIITDDGGINGNFTPGSDGLLVLYPATIDSMVRIQGTIHLPDYSDLLRIYDGVGTDGTLFYQGYGDSVAIGPFTASSGPMTIAFSSDSYSQGDGGFELQVSCVEAPTCKYPRYTRADNIGVNNAQIVWDLIGSDEWDVPTSFNVELIELSSATSSTRSVSEQSVVLGNLDPGTFYKVRVQGNCGGIVDSVVFATLSLPCATYDTVNSDSVTVSDTVFSSSQYVPVNFYYDYSISQQLFRAEELDSVDVITAIEFQTVIINDTTRTWEIYLANVTDTTINSWIPTADMVRVFDGDVVIPAATWFRITFDQPFSYDPTRNLVVMVYDKTGSYNAQTNTFQSHTINHMSRVEGRDGVGFDLNNLSGGWEQRARNNTRFISARCTSAETCIAPNARIAAVESDAIDLTWTPGYQETAWEVAYKVVGDSVWTIDDPNCMLTNYTITNLQPNTSYNIRVSAICGSDSASAVLLAKTSCVAYDSLPFTESFDNGFAASFQEGSAVEPCWSRHSNNDYYVYPSLSEEYSLDGDYSMEFSCGSSTYSFIVLPLMADDITTLELNFMSYCYDYSINSRIIVGVMTDPNDLNTLSTVNTITPTEANAWEAHRVLFTDYIGEGQYIAIGSRFTSSTYFIDQLSVNHIQTCVVPSRISVDSILTTSAVVSWDDSLSPAYEVEYGFAGFERGEGTVVVANSNRILLTGLASSSTYDVYVRALCSATDTSAWSLVRQFETACGPIASVPYTDDFSSYETYDAPRCWNINGDIFVASYDDDNNLITIGTTYFVSEAYAQMPMIDTSININNLQISFSVSDNYSSGSMLIVGLCDSSRSLSSMLVLDTIQPTDDMVFHEYVLSNVPDSKRVVTFVNAGEMYTSCEIDNIIIETASSCRRVSNMTATNGTDTSVVINWTDHNQSSAWEVEYGVSGFVSGQGTRTIVTTLPHTITGLTANTSYEYNVRSICSATDTGNWSYMRKEFSTTQAPAAVPYNYDFENVSEWNNWQNCTNTNTASWTRGTAAAQSGSYSAYLSRDGGLTAGVSSDYRLNAALYRDINFGSNDTSFILNFDARSGGNGTVGGLVVLLVDPNAPIVSSSDNAVSPWGSVDTLYQYANVTFTDTVWSHQSVSIDNVSGVRRLAFFWFNNYDFDGIPGHVDNIEIQYAECPRPSNVTAGNITGTSATLSWNGPANTQYEVLVQEMGSNAAAQSLLTNNNTIALSNLAYGTSYSAIVRKICGNDTSLYSDACLFVTLCNENAITVFPFVESFEGSINCWEQEFVSGQDEWLISQGNYDNDDVFQGEHNVVFAPCISGEIVTKLISPVLDLTVLDSAYLVFAHTQEDWSGDFDTLSVYYRTSENGEWNYLRSWNTVIESWQVDSVYLPNPSATYQFAFEGYNRYGYGIAIDSVVVYGTQATCSTPIVTVDDYSYGSIDISWNGNGDAYEVAIKTINTAQWPEAIAVNSTSYTFTNLRAATTYHLRVRRDCRADSLGYSDWSSVVAVTTDSLPCYAPVNLEISEVGYGTATIDWTASDGEEQWIVNIFRTDANIIDTVSSHPYSVEGLFAGMNYSVAVQTVCGNGASYSNWSDTLSFTTNICEPVSDVSAEVDVTVVEISWTAAEGTEAWQINYGELDFTTDQGTLVDVTTNPYAIENLEPGNYDVYVRTKCDENIFSVWSNKVQFVVPVIGIEDVLDGQEVAIYPNPTTGNTTISVSGANGLVKVDIVDINGRTVVSESMECTGDCVKKMDVNALAQGAYFVRITGENINLVKKLIVR